jgi:N-acetyl-alpha-D-muramate 1-phosphate uridylyltransferase
VVLAAGAGERLRPLTARRPKPLCPVGGVALVDLALDRVAVLGAPVAVNLHHGRDEIAAHLGQRSMPVHLSVEEPAALGTAGALGALRDWIDGRGVLVHNADVWSPVDLAPFVDGWDGTHVRVLISGPEGAVFGPTVGLVATLLPWTEVVRLDASPAGLYETTLRRAAAEGRLDAVACADPFVDCGTPSDYLRANLSAAALTGGSIVDGSVRVEGSIESSVVGAGAVVAGRIRDCVLWEGAVVVADESLRGVIRVAGMPDLEP